MSPRWDDLRTDIVPPLPGERDAWDGRDDLFPHRSDVPVSSDLATAHDEEEATGDDASEDF
jgi:hypothetical protein